MCEAQQLLHARMWIYAHSVKIIPFHICCMQLTCSMMVWAQWSCFTSMAMNVVTDGKCLLGNFSAYCWHSAVAPHDILPYVGCMSLSSSDVNSILMNTVCMLPTMQALAKQLAASWEEIRLWVEKWKSVLPPLFMLVCVWAIPQRQLMPQMA